MKAAVVLMKYDYGIPERGYSYEYYNIYLPLADVLGKENIFLFDFFAEYKKHGKEKINIRLKEFIYSEKPDMALFCLFENEFDEEIIKSLKETTRTCVYFFDDPWRQKFVRHWIKYFHFFSTPDYYMHRQYLSEGVNNVIFSPFGFNSSIYKKLDLKKDIDVSFVGGFSPLRKWIIDRLKKNKINVKVFGRGWGNESWISQEKMVEIFNRSKINLNLSNAWFYDIRLLLSSLKSPKAIKQLLLLRKTREQVKGRHYEINGCGGFQLSNFIPGLNLAYEIDKEIAVYEDFANIPSMIKLFLKDDDLRNKIADNGYSRSVKDHTAQNYMKNLISQAMTRQI
jgi:spore maturation protein CgeB